MKPANRANGLIVLLGLMLISAGCHSCGIDNGFGCCAGLFPKAGFSAGNDNSLLAAAAAAYQTGLQHELSGSANCVDHYCQAALVAWPEVLQQVDANGVPQGPASDLYQAALRKLLVTGQQFGRLDPARGMEATLPGGRILIPATFHGFPWEPASFDRVEPVAAYRAKDLNHQYSCRGLGVATVVYHQRLPHEMFRHEKQAFPATVVLRPTVLQDNTGPYPYVLEFFDPLRLSSVRTPKRELILERDISAPLALRQRIGGNEAIKNFLQPGSSSKDLGLFMIEPYQPGKIPVIFVHGLMSDPLTWANIANELRAHPELLQRYQIWGFEYATGEPFLKSAAILRAQLEQLAFQFDPSGSDPALSKMVLVGHSMGGLVSKLQITSSGDALWNSAAYAPLQQIATDDATRHRLYELFYFEPSPRITRVVFVGTPHRGSPTAMRMIGKIGECLIREPNALAEHHRQLVATNPNMFTREFSRRIPNSVDLLEPDSQLLLAIDALPRNPAVGIHTIYGQGYHMLGGGDSDKVVPVSSARLLGSHSEKGVHTKHTELHKHDEGISEVLRILELHAN